MWESFENTVCGVICYIERCKSANNNNNNNNNTRPTKEKWQIFRQYYIHSGLWRENNKGVFVLATPHPFPPFSSTFRPVWRENNTNHTASIYWSSASWCNSWCMAVISPWKCMLSCCYVNMLWMVVNGSQHANWNYSKKHVNMLRALWRICVLLHWCVCAFLHLQNNKMNLSNLLFFSLSLHSFHFSVRVDGVMKFLETCRECLSFLMKRVVGRNRINSHAWNIYRNFSVSFFLFTSLESNQNFWSYGGRVAEHFEHTKEWFVSFSFWLIHKSVGKERCGNSPMSSFN